jgi:hypothetical protein
MTPCPNCGSGSITYSARAPNKKPARRVFLCRDCLHCIEFDTPNRGSDVAETRNARDSLGFALWRKAKASDMRKWL